ncbi:DUF4097 and DUF4098 domain-containing protein YvlB [Anoxybacillus vitaminiphilus]|uniref:DUF4097 and DUF4098 domain-containing protein YvlB n=1 Tax=Paranoxybacillus vitaminiphilus TaxID=581036 RepID=A0A327YGG7_9BACL|nr:DUF4097 domain-containing protein [Anoxybacillus vitaminiphilus]RAK19963.1 DUF4097 and DUF4098 domain-containing protein YvlB [Anoxybacillus vitaminiphilus]
MEERKRILKMVEEGKLTAEEALMLLEQLEQAEKKAAEAITALSTDVQFTETKQDESSSVKWSSLKEKVFDFLDVTFKKVKNFDLDLNFGNSFEIKHIFQQNSAFFQTIDIDVANGSVELVPWNESDIRIECDAKVYRVDSAEAARQLFLREVLFSVDKGCFRFSVPKQQLKVHTVIYLPQSAYDYGKIRLFNGDIRGEKLQMKKMRAKTANGAIKFAGINAENVELETVHGAITITESTVRQLEAENIHGAVQISGKYHKADLQSISGSIMCRIENMDSDTVLSKTVTGSIQILLPEQIAFEGELKTNIGGLSYHYPGITVIEEKKETIQKLVRLKANVNETRGTYVYADTKTGSISIKAMGDGE